MFTKFLMLAGLMCVWSCSGDEKAGANLGGAGSDSAGSAGRSEAGASGSGSGGKAGESAAGHGGSATGGAMMGGAGEVAGGSGNLGGASGAGSGGAAAGAGGDENPYRGCDGEDRTDNSCPVAGSICDADFGCEPPCPTGTASCPSPPAEGTATTYCQQSLCRLDCGFGKTCPAGMTCDKANLYCTANGL